MGDKLHHLEGWGRWGPGTHQIYSRLLLLEQGAGPARHWGTGAQMEAQDALPLYPEERPGWQYSFLICRNPGRGRSLGWLSDGSTLTASLQALLTPEDAVLSDELNHASIIDGIRLCKAHKYRYRHLDMADLEAKLQEAQVGPYLGPPSASIWGRK